MQIGMQTTSTSRQRWARLASNESVAHAISDRGASSQEAKLVALVSLAIRVLPLECAVTPGLSSRLTALMRSRIDFLECALRDVRASQGIAHLHRLELSVVFLRDQLNAVAGARRGLERDIHDLSTKIGELRSKAAYDSEQISWLQDSLAMASHSAAAEQEAATKAREELVWLRESFRCNLSEPERHRVLAAASAPTLPVACKLGRCPAEGPAQPSTSCEIALKAPAILRDDLQCDQRELVVSAASTALHHSYCTSGDGSRPATVLTAEPNANVSRLLTGSELLIILAQTPNANVARLLTGSELLIILAQAAACEGSDVPTACALRGTSSVAVGRMSHMRAPQTARSACVGAVSDPAIVGCYDSGLGSRVVFREQAAPAPFTEARALPLQPAGEGKQSQPAPESSANGPF